MQIRQAEGEYTPEAWFAAGVVLLTVFSGSSALFAGQIDPLAFWILRWTGLTMAALMFCGGIRQYFINVGAGRALVAKLAHVRRNHVRRDRDASGDLLSRHNRSRHGGADILLHALALGPVRLDDFGPPIATSGGENDSRNLVALLRPNSR